MDSRKAFEEWAKDKQSDVALVAAARAAFKWPVGKELTEQEFDEALDRAGNTTILGEAPAMPKPDTH
jgi:hypothetical protein